MWWRLASPIHLQRDEILTPPESGSVEDGQHVFRDILLTLCSWCVSMK
jgi:hypothetical protein